MSKGCKRRKGNGFAESYDRIFGMKAPKDTSEYDRLVKLRKEAKDVKS